MSRLILPGQPEHRSRLTIYVPRGHEAETVLRCNLCGRTWPESQRAAWEGHFRRCVEDNREVIDGLRLEARMPVFEDWDPEVAAHMRQVGARMLRERRLTVRPNERAGFS